MQEILNGGVGDGFAGRVCGLRARAKQDPATDGFAGDAVFGELVHERAGEDGVEKGVHLLNAGRVGGIQPGGAPENGEDFDVGEKRAPAISEEGHGGGSFTDVRMDGNDAEREFDPGF